MKVFKKIDFLFFNIIYILKMEEYKLHDITIFSKNGNWGMYWKLVNKNIYTYLIIEKYYDSGNNFKNYLDVNPEELNELLNTRNSFYKYTNNLNNNDYKEVIEELEKDEKIDKEKMRKFMFYRLYYSYICNSDTIKLMGEGFKIPNKCITNWKKLQMCIDNNLLNEELTYKTILTVFSNNKRLKDFIEYLINIEEEYKLISKIPEKTKGIATFKKAILESGQKVLINAFNNNISNEDLFKQYIKDNNIKFIDIYKDFTLIKKDKYLPEVIKIIPNMILNGITLENIKKIESVIGKINFSKYTNKTVQKEYYLTYCQKINIGYYIDDKFYNDKEYIHYILDQLPDDVLFVKSNISLFNYITYTGNMKQWNLINKKNNYLQCYCLNRMNNANMFGENDKSSKDDSDDSDDLVY